MSKLKGLAGVVLAAVLAWARSNSAVIGGLFRALLAAVGGWLVNSGYFAESDVAALSGNADAVTGVVLLVMTVVWSWLSKLGGGTKSGGVKNG